VGGNGIRGDDVAILGADCLGEPGSEPDGFIESVKTSGGGGDGIVNEAIVGGVMGGLLTMVSGVHPGRGDGNKRIGVSSNDGIFTLCTGRVNQGIGMDVMSEVAMRDQMVE
jgi:hypothetical protein